MGIGCFSLFISVLGGLGWVGNGTGTWVMGAGGGLGRGWVGKDLYYDKHGLSDIAKSILCFTDLMVSRNREYHQCGTSELVILTSLTNFNG